MAGVIMGVSIVGEPELQTLGLYCFQVLNAVAYLLMPVSFRMIRDLSYFFKGLF